MRPSLISSYHILKSLIIQHIFCILLCIQRKWPYRLTVRTEPSQGLNRGSIPRKVTIFREAKIVVFKRNGITFK